MQKSLSHFIKAAVNRVMPPTNETQASDTRAPATKIANWICGNFCSRSWSPSNSDCNKRNGQLNQGGKLLLKHAVKWKGSNQRKRRKVMVATKEPNIQSTERDPKQNVIAACNEFALYFQVLFFNVFQFQLNRNVFHRHDEFFVRNLESTCSVD